MEETNSATAPLFYLPGWYWYLENEKDFRELPNAENVLAVCLRVLSAEFRIMGFHEFFTTVAKLLRQPNQIRINYEPYLKKIHLQSSSSYSNDLKAFFYCKCACHDSFETFTSK